VNQHFVSLIPNYISLNSSAKNDLYCTFNNVVKFEGSNYNEIEQKKEGARAVNPDNSSEDGSHYEPNHNSLNSLPQYEIYHSIKVSQIFIFW